MINRKVSVFLLLLSVAVSAHADWESSILPKDFVFESSLTKAVSTAQGAGKAVIVYYTRTQCPPCDVLQWRLRKEEVGNPYRSAYVFTAVWGTAIGYTERENYRSKYGVPAAPTWIVFNSRGKYVCTAPGGFGSDEAGLRLHEAVQSLLAQAEGEANAVRTCM